jgi:putative sigma-54 modulation protein
MNVIITGRKVKVTVGIRTKVDEMLKKHEKFLKHANKIQVELAETTSHGGVDSDTYVEMVITMPKAIVRIVEKGRDFYAVIDAIDPILRRRLVRYNQHARKWEGKESWKLPEKEQFEKEIATMKEDVYADDLDVKPSITRYKQFSQNSPMHPAEAIERMELYGHEAFLFKNIETGKYSTVYKRSDGTYGLLEPKE